MVLDQPRRPLGASNRRPSSESHQFLVTAHQSLGHPLESQADYLVLGLAITAECIGLDSPMHRYLLCASPAFLILHSTLRTALNLAKVIIHHPSDLEPVPNRQPPSAGAPSPWVSPTSAQ